MSQSYHHLIFFIIFPGLFSLTNCKETTPEVPQPVFFNPFQTDVFVTEAIKYNSILLIAPPADNNSNRKNFFSTESGEVFSSNEAIASMEIAGTIDFGYFWGDIGFAQLASPKLFLSFPGYDQWSKANDITFTKTNLSFDDFMQISTWEAIDEAYGRSSTLFGSNLINDLQQQQVIAFQTDINKPEGARRGLIAILTIQEGGVPNGFMEINVVFQKER